MRNRQLRHEYITDKRLIDSGCEARFLFLGLVCLADKAGRYKVNIKQIKSLIFPCDDVNIPATLTLLDRIGMIRLYYADNVAYLHFPEWKKQRLYGAEKESVLPSPTKQISHANKSLLAQPQEELNKAPSNTPYAQYLSFYQRYNALKKSNKNDRALAWGIWQRLEKTKALPDLSVLVKALKEQGTPTINLSTWLKNKKWLKVQHRQENCTICFGEGIYYGRKEDGTRSPVPCKCRH